MVKAFLVIRFYKGAIRKFPVYREICRLFEEELLKRHFERGNLFDMFLIKVCRFADHGKIIFHIYLVLFEDQQNIWLIMVRQLQRKFGQKMYWLKAIGDPA